MSTFRQKDRFIAIVLALFLGGIGIHKFYLERTKAGVLYFLFCWTFIPSFLALIDVFRLAFMSPDDFDNEYNGQ